MQYSNIFVLDCWINFKKESESNNFDPFAQRIIIGYFYSFSFHTLCSALS